MSEELTQVEWADIVDTMFRRHTAADNPTDKMKYGRLADIVRKHALSLAPEVEEPKEPEDEWAGPNLIIEGVGTQLPEEKRCYVLGVVLKTHCPGCGEEFERDLSAEYLSYSSLKVKWHCEWDQDVEPYSTLGCGTSWETPLAVEIRFSPAEENADTDEDEETR